MYFQKVVLSVIRLRMKDHRERRTREQQAGFRGGRGCMDQIFCLHQVFEWRIISGQRFVAIFIDYLAAFDSVHRECMWKAVLVDGIPAKIVNILRNYYEGAECFVRVYGKFTDGFNVTTGVRQGCILSPMIFNIVIDWIMNCAGASPFVVGKDLSSLMTSENQGGEFWLWHTSDHSWWHSAWSCAYLCLLGILHFQRFHYIFRLGGMSNRQSMWCLCQIQGVCLKATQHKLEDKDEDLQRCSHHHFVVCFWVLDAVGKWLDETRGFPDELWTSYGITRYSTVARNNPPLGSGLSGIVFDGLDMDDFCLPKQLLWAERPDG